MPDTGWMKGRVGRVGLKCSDTSQLRVFDCCKVCVTVGNVFNYRFALGWPFHLFGAIQ